MVDWEHPANKDFLLISQFSVTGALSATSAFILHPRILASGLVVIELKKSGVPARAAFDENLTHYKQQVPALFGFNALHIASNGTDSRVGSLTADWERSVEWKHLEREDEPRRVSLEVMLRGNPRYVFTLIHTFRPESCSSGRESAHTSGQADQSRLTSAATSEEVMPVLCDRPDVIVLTDEAHHSQYDTLAMNRLPRTSTARSSTPG